MCFSNSWGQNETPVLLVVCFLQLSSTTEAIVPTPFSKHWYELGIKHLTNEILRFTLYTSKVRGHSQASKVSIRMIYEAFDKF